MNKPQSTTAFADVKSPSKYYTDSIASLSANITQRRRRNHLFVAGEIISFAAVVAFITAYSMLEWGMAAVCMAALSLVAYCAIRYADERNEARIAWIESLREVCSRELSYLRDDYAAFDDGKRYADPQHPFTTDIDVFGPKSLFQRICRTATTGGSDRLAAILSAEPIEPLNIVADRAETFDVEMTPTERINKRADAIEALRHATEWRIEFCAVGVNHKLDTNGVTRAMQAVGNVKMPKFIGSTIAVGIASCMCFGLFAAIVLAATTNMPSSVAVVWAIAQLGIVLGLCHGKLRQISGVVGKLQQQMAAYVKLLILMNKMPKLVTSAGDTPELLARLVGATQGAIDTFNEMERILAGLDRRGNILGLIFSDIFALSDFHLLRRFAKCQSRCAANASRWIAAVNEMDALVSMATFGYNEPHGIRAQIVNDRNIVFKAEGLRHPFLGAKAVANDFSLSQNNYYIITGANMAGKSTFLRSLGINWLLAMSGMPVFAHSLQLSVFPLFTSMRTTDDLTRGISYFNAELLRLKSLIDFCACHNNTLIILDEILKGTNSADKLGGSRLFLEYMSQKHVTGVIATHDLELSRIADEQPLRFHNYCFEIELGRNVTYSYKITQGVARNKNATFLLRELLTE